MSWFGWNRHSGDWYCKGCNFKMFSHRKFCRKCNLDKNGNKVDSKGNKITGNNSGNTSTNYSGDWYCKGCGFKLFANKTHCYKCRLDRNGNPLPGSQNRAGDWKCNGCGFLIYSSKDRCTKCNMDKNGNPLDDDTKIADDNLCSICFSQPKNTIFMHEEGNDAHQSCCYACAHQIFTTTKKCPMCMKKVKQVIKIYKT